MRAILIATVLFVSASGSIWGQAPPATPSQLGYFRYVLTTLANPMYDQQFVAKEADLIIASWALNEGEAAAFRSAVQKMHVVLEDVRKERTVIVSRRSVLTSTDRAEIDALSGRVEDGVTLLANQILNSVRPEIAARLRRAGEIVANATKIGVN